MTDRTRLSLWLLGVLLSATQPALALHDPTRPTDPARYFGENGMSSRPWTLHSILHSPDRRIAIINGQRVQEGDRVGSAKVLRIGNSHVLLQTGGHRLTLRLLPGSTRVSP